MMIRTFHPVGQGAFYSEEHSDGINIVYDCGSNAPTRSRSVVDSSFRGKDIYILFISHFDTDHISTIPTLLKSVKSIKFVVIPLMDNEQINLLINIYYYLPDDLKKLITNPREFFGSNTKVIRVKPAGSNKESYEDPIIIEDIPRRFSSETGYTEIDSGIPLTIGKLNKESWMWAFIPYNYESEKRKDELVELLVDNGFDISRMKSDPAYVLTDAVTKDKGEKIRDIYKQLSGNINQNSLLVYSGPLKLKEESKCICNLLRWLSPCDDLAAYTCRLKSGCIYTGDSDFNQIVLKDVYPKHLRYVGIVQIPHHGASSNFNIKSLEGCENVICPVSHGFHRKYKHPHDSVIKELVINGFKPVSVNSDLNSKFEQIIPY
mgnify:CR=1 FL=1